MCKEWNVPRLVYTSTVNVVFTGKPIVDCDEDSVPYVPPAVVSATSCLVLPKLQRMNQGQGGQ